MSDYMGRDRGLSGASPRPPRPARRGGHVPPPPSGRIPPTAPATRPPPRDRLPPPPPNRTPPPEVVAREVRSRAPQPRPEKPPEAGARRVSGNRELLRRLLASPRAARQAFLLHEVLGPPVSLRSDARDRPA